MKSRFLASTLVMLLGLFSTNLFAQLSDATTVDFLLKNDLTGAPYRTTTTAREDTVGHPALWKFTWEAGSQAKDVTTYRFTFPEGTVTDQEELEDEGILVTYTFSAENIVTNYVPAANIQVTGNPLGSSYSASTPPVIVITAHRDWNSYARYDVEFVSGLYHGSSVTGINRYSYNGTDDQGNMLVKFKHSDLTTTFQDSTSFYISNDAADSVYYNSSIGGFVSGQYWPGGDSIMVVDRFGNFVRDFFDDTDDSLIISVGSSVGTFTSRLVNNGVASVPQALLDTLGAGNKIRFQGSGAAFHSSFSSNALLDSTAGGAATGKLYQQVDINGTNTWAVRAKENDDLINVPLFLGNTTPRTASPYPYTLGVKLTTATAVEEGDTISITINLGSKDASRQSAGTLLGVPANRTVTIRRVLYESDVSDLIGEIVLTMPEVTALGTQNPYYNGLPLSTTGAATLTIKDKFGDLFAAKDVGTETDKLVFELRYLTLTYDDDGDSDDYGEITGWTQNSTMTGILHDGTSIGDFDRPATHFLDPSGTDIFVADTIKGADATTSSSGVLTFSSVRYYGTTSHPNNEAIRVVVYAQSTPDVRDSALITVEPSPPVAWELSTFSANLQTAIDDGEVVKGARIPVELPIFALDTAYNYVSNMDLLYDAGFLDGVSVASTAGVLNAINFKIDGVDPLGYGNYASATTNDSIKIDSMTLTGSAGRGNIADANAKADPSFIYDYDFERADSSRLNLGGSGANDMGLRLKYQGVNYRLTMIHKPGRLAGKYGAAPADVSTDLGLFTLLSPTLIDSVTNVSAFSFTSAADTAGAVLNNGLVVKFKVPTDNIIEPNRSDSLAYIKFMSLPDGAGIPVGITKEDVECSVDNVNYYDAVAIGQGGEGLEDSIGVVVSVKANENDYYYIRLKGFVNPTKSDTSYGVQVATKASPVWAHNNAAWAPGDASFGGLKLKNPGGTTLAVPKYFSSGITQTKDTLIAGQEYMYKVFLGDRHGNVKNMGSGNRGLIFKSADTTLTGAHTAVRQRTTAGHGGHMYDSLWVSYDTLATSGTKYALVDSIFITPKYAADYYLVVIDSAKSTIRDSVLVTVKPTTIGSLTIVEPLGVQKANTGAVVDSSLTVLLKDTFGNVLPDSVVRYVVSSGSGTFRDSMGVTVATPNDTLSVVTNAEGKAMAKLTAGTSDEITVEVDVPTNTGITAVEFNVSTSPVVITGPSVVNFKSPPAALVQDTLVGVTITADVSDAEYVKIVYLRAITTALELQEDGTYAAAATSDTAVVDTLEVSTATEDSVRFTGLIPAQKLGTTVVYDIDVIDVGLDTTMTWTDTTDDMGGTYTVSPKAGKQDLTADAVKVGDLIRTVYLFLKDPPAITYRLIDYLGLDRDANWVFEPADITAVLALWRGGSTTLLASAAEEQDRSAKLSMAYEAIDKATATLSINLENQGSLNFAALRVKYDTDKFVFGEVKAAQRLEGVDVHFANNETEGIYSIVVINIKGRPISTGNGAILTIPVSAVGEKFDGEGEISLLEAGFEPDVAAEINGEALSPKAILPKAFALGQNYPNPFNPSTTIAFDIPEGKEAFVRLNVYNIRGQLVRTLASETMDEGSYKIEWDGKDNNGRFVASGVYFYRIQAGEFSKTRKMVILK
ncbi:MAG: T9SS type A sorting domain-containing protein [Candidatus Glassbacteria bacterium]|nr:T9SS type A sorting domain-containing protein [Candidatus Glassbacteria bacterium]